MRFTIGFKIFSIALGLLVLMGAAALLSLRMTQTIDAQLVVVDQNYFPGFTTLATANVSSLTQGMLARRLVLNLTGGEASNPEKQKQLRGQIAAAGTVTDAALVEARRNINDQITDPLDFDDNVALARLDTKVEFLQEARGKYEGVLARLLAAVETGKHEEIERLEAELDELRDDFDRRIDTARNEMRSIVSGAIDGTRAYQLRAIEISVGVLIIAGLLGLTVAAAVTTGLVRPVRRLLAGTAAVEKGVLDTLVPITSRDEIGRLTHSFNNMVGELRVKAQIRETFGKYVDPRIVSGLLDRPELTGSAGSRREMTILFCDMKGFTSFSEGMTPAGLVNVLNRYLTVISDPVRRNNGIIDKYIGDAVMAFWGPPFTGPENQARLACFAALEQIAALPGFQAELPDLMGLRRGLPQVSVRVGVATGEVVIGSIGSEQTRSYTVIGDTVNFASRLEGASKAYGTHILVSEATQLLAADAIETREIDSVLVVGKSEPERVFELLGRKGEVSVERLELRDTFGAALADYRGQRWDKAAKGFRDCLTITPDDPPSKVFIERIAQFRDHRPAEDWAGVWALQSK